SINDSCNESTQLSSFLLEKKITPKNETKNKKILKKEINDKNMQKSIRTFNSIDSIGWTDLIRSVIYKNDNLFFSLVNDKSVDFEIRDIHQGKNALHWAASTGNTYACQEIIKRKPNLVHSLDTVGQTPLFYSVDNNQIYDQRVQSNHDQNIRPLIPNDNQHETANNTFERIFLGQIDQNVNNPFFFTQPPTQNGYIIYLSENLNN
ncbi:hypothetical protein MXB_3096, partial [Myxobolus squamalis]